MPDANDPKIYAPGTTLVPPEKRVEHIAIIKPDICSLDLNTMNSGADVVINTPRNVRIMAKIIRDSGVKPELEIFDSGDLHLARDLINDGTLDGPGMWTFVLGVKYGFAATPETLLYARNLLPTGAIWSAFGLGECGNDGSKEPINASTDGFCQCFGCALKRDVRCSDASRHTKLFSIDVCDDVHRRRSKR